MEVGISSWVSWDSFTFFWEPWVYTVVYVNNN